MKQQLIDHLCQFVTGRRVQLFDKVLDLRTRYMTVVLEDIYQAHNASAVLRSCECFGIQDVHIIENTNNYHISPDVALGSDKWLTLYRYNNGTGNTLKAIDSLKEKGYRIVATSPHKNDCNLEDFDLDKGKFALMFGTELTGLSDNAIRAADEFVKIPMTGFTESLNISVTAALFIHQFTNRFRKSQLEWQLSDEEKMDLKITWLKNSIKSASLIEQAFLKATGNKPEKAD